MYSSAFSFERDPQFYFNVNELVLLPHYRAYRPIPRSPTTTWTLTLICMICNCHKCCILSSGGSESVNLTLSRFRCAHSSSSRRVTSFQSHSFKFIGWSSRLFGALLVCTVKKQKQLIYLYVSFQINVAVQILYR